MRCSLKLIARIAVSRPLEIFHLTANIKFGVGSKIKLFVQNYSAFNIEVLSFKCLVSAAVNSRTQPILHFSARPLHV